MRHGTVLTRWNSSHMRPDDRADTELSLEALAFVPAACVTLGIVILTESFVPQQVGSVIGMALGVALYLRATWREPRPERHRDIRTAWLNVGLIVLSSLQADHVDTRVHRDGPDGQEGRRISVRPLRSAYASQSSH